MIVTYTAKNFTTQSTTTDRVSSSETSEGVAEGLTAQQQDTAQYVADMILEMRNLAKAARLFTITVPLEYAYYEAFSIANRVKVPPEELERIRHLEKSARQAEPEEPKKA
jgi:hypothetical protein